MIRKAVSLLMLTLLLIATPTLSFKVQPAKSEPYETRLHIRESPPGSWVPGVPVGQWVWLIVDIESPIAWDNTPDGIVGWVLSVHVDPDVLEPINVYAATFGYWLYDFASGHGCVTHLSVDINATAGDIDASELMGCLMLGVGAGGNSGPGGYGELGLCRLRFRSKSETSHTLIDIYDAFWVDINGTKHAFDVVDDGHYNQPEVPAPDLCIEGIVLPYTDPRIYASSWGECFYYISATVINQGTADAGFFNVSFAVHLDGGIMPQYERNKTVESLQQGVNETLAFDFNPMEYGNFTLTITVDCGDDIDELDETNNVEIVSLICTIRCDFYIDGCVDFDDFIIFAGKYGQKYEAPPYSIADTDWDGDVDFDDFIWFTWYYGKTV